MITYDTFENEIKNKTIKNSYIFCGGDEELIKEGIDFLVKPIVKDGFEDLNYTRLDGLTTTMDDIMNACETMPFMGEKKVVLVYRANFLRDKSDSSATKIYNELKEYLRDVPEFTVIILYYVFNDKRENPKKNKKLMALDKITEIVHFDKLKRDRFVKKVEDVFREKEKEIGKFELRFFCERVQNNFNIIRREVDKLIDYTNGRSIKKEDIEKLIPSKSEEDIFDLVDLISQRKIEKAIDIMDELLFKADQHMLIITSIESQFKKLYNIKLGMEKGKRVNDFVAELKVPSFVCEKLMNLSSKFSRRQLEELVKLSVDTEARLKSSGVDKTMELELLLLNTLMIKK
ncbi:MULTISPECIES: DNA polymerase III subunit delta [Clostridium]|uniref:DNA polymerase III subunit delta n=1 Tax=Clostridium cibarium TaxID=2762247 RepID=A0ABR8PNP4_9CLOT|nr:MULTISPECIES: DNA polymerase III subunit delta [Clostridium]MBD7909807.1 DNA polymerase III subunit delta [Clostridium cibarium]